MTAVAAKKNKADTEKTEKADRGLSYKDVQILFLSDGIGKIEKFLKGGIISVPSLRKAALNFVETKNKNGQVLVDFVEARFPSGERGRKSPEAGDNRRYKAQQIKDGALFIRLPVDTLVDEKGGVVEVFFKDGSIIVKAAPKGSKADDSDEE
jgi:hypothetical protein